ncbi:MAG: type VI secretion system tip protein TssI/VgrG [Hansschlegelia sp.]
MAARPSPLLLLKSPLGDDRRPFQEGTLHAVEMTAREELSAPFEIDILAVSTEQAIDPDRLLHQPLTITVRRKDGVDRLFHGVVRRMEAVGSDQRDRWQYRLELAPRLWFLSQTIDCRIFQQKTAVEILKEIFAEHGVEPVDFRLFGKAPVRPYTTQFDETDLQFVQRIMQESGYFYFFEHAASKHTLVIADRNQAFRPQPEPLHRVIYQGDNSDIVDAWHDSRATAFGRVQLQDYDPEKPRNPVNGEQQTRSRTAGAARRRVYRWPAMTMDNAVAADRARFRQEAAEAAAALCRGHGYDPNFCPGFRFTLETDPVTGAKGVEHVIRSVVHTASDDTWLAGTSAPQFESSFVCFRQSVTWRDDLSIPRPAMTGVFSGIVLGEPGEEIHADRLARVKVQPLFDHRKDTTAAKSIFVRILHAWSGDGWGWQHLPRVGTEVGISFMNGDPDNPVVVGCFYHDENRPAFPIPAEQTKQGFRSRSTLRGGKQDYNELSFDDRAGQEVVLLHAQKDHTVEVENDQDVEIGRDRAVTTTRNDRLTSRTGAITVTAAAGPVTISAATTLTLRVGASSIVMTPAGITITTPSLAIQAASIRTVGASFDITAAAFTVKAAAVVLATPLLEAPPPIPPV